MAQVQPGMMVQRQHRTQIATQQQGTAMNTVHEASALRHARPAPVAAMAAGVMMLGLGFAALRPRRATARVRRKGLRS
jgi:hypothetical protein